ncbi:hypothetical protein FB45DRAFT_1084196 [Roridomyces roridus]|uniref:Uncharacterized protein n=1 Tax=Roridomyces roridus TaxID=1738132 RepID=A0AAD7FKU8_9AGAR|nr:hypothetical protein FB45DRAFT_1084196 [Roridomyces roridus]
MSSPPENQIIDQLIGNRAAILFSFMLLTRRSRPLLRPPLLRTHRTHSIRSFCLPSVHQNPIQSTRRVWWQRTQKRCYSDEATTRIDDEGIPLQVRPSSLPPTSLTNCPALWSDNGCAPRIRRHPLGRTHRGPHRLEHRLAPIPYLLTLFAFSPYFLRLPQIEMLVTVKHAIPGEPLPIMYSPTRQELVFQIDFTQQVKELKEEGEMVAGADEGTAGVAEVFLLNCRTFDLYVYDAAQSTHAPATIDELLLLIAASPTPEGVPLVKVPPDEDGAAVLKRILDRDETVVSVLEEEYLGYSPRITTREEEVVSADDAAKATREKLAEAIETARQHIKEAEKELESDEDEIKTLREEAEMADLEGEEEEKVEKELVDEELAYSKMRAAVDDAKAKLAAMEEAYKQRHARETQK